MESFHGSAAEVVTIDSCKVNIYEGQAILQLFAINDAPANVIAKYTCLYVSIDIDELHESLEAGDTALQTFQHQL